MEEREVDVSFPVLKEPWFYVGGLESFATTVEGAEYYEGAEDEDEVGYWRDCRC